MSRAATTLVAIPMKDPADAKSRLRKALSPGQRAALAVALFEQTILRLQTLVSACPEIHIEIAAVTASSAIRRIAQSRGLHLVADNGAGLSNAAEQARQWAAKQGFRALCILPGDLAAPTHADLRLLLAQRLKHASVVLCPSLDMGTNALLMPVPCAMQFHYGPRSFLAHYRAARACGLTPVVLPLNSLRHDVDTQADLPDPLPGIAGSPPLRSAP